MKTNQIAQLSLDGFQINLFLEEIEQRPSSVVDVEVKEIVQ